MNGGYGMVTYSSNAVADLVIYMFEKLIKSNSSSNRMFSRLTSTVPLRPNTKPPSEYWLEVKAPRNMVNKDMIKKQVSHAGHKAIHNGSVIMQVAGRSNHGHQGIWRPCVKSCSWMPGHYRRSLAIHLQECQFKGAFIPPYCEHIGNLIKDHSDNLFNLFRKLEKGNIILPLEASNSSVEIDHNFVSVDNQYMPVGVAAKYLAGTIKHNRRYGYSLMFDQDDLEEAGYKPMINYVSPPKKRALKLF